MSGDTQWIDFYMPLTDRDGLIKPLKAHEQKPVVVERDGIPRIQLQSAAKLLLSTFEIEMPVHSDGASRAMCLGEILIQLKCLRRRGLGRRKCHLERSLAANAHTGVCLRESGPGQGIRRIFLHRFLEQFGGFFSTARRSLAGAL